MLLEKWWPVLKLYRMIGAFPFKKSNSNICKFESIPSKEIFWRFCLSTATMHLSGFAYSLYLYLTNPEIFKSYLSLFIGDSKVNIFAYSMFINVAYVCHCYIIYILAKNKEALVELFNHFNFNTLSKADIYPKCEKMLPYGSLILLLTTLITNTVLMSYNSHVIFGTNAIEICFASLIHFLVGVTWYGPILSYQMIVTDAYNYLRIWINKLTIKNDLSEEDCINFYKVGM